MVPFSTTILPNQQVFTLNTVAGLSVPVQTLTNAGKSEIQGVETELEYTGLDNWYIKAGLAWLDTEFKEYETISPATGEITSFAGNEQPAAPTWNLNGIVRYYSELDSGAMVSLQTDFTFVDDQFFTADNNPSLTEEAYWLVNARVTYNSPDDDYSVSLWVKNLTGEDYITTAFDTAQFGVNSNRCGRIHAHLGFPSRPTLNRPTCVPRKRGFFLPENGLRRELKQQVPV